MSANSHYYKIWQTGNGRIWQNLTQKTNNKQQKYYKMAHINYKEQFGKISNKLDQTVRDCKHTWHRVFTSGILKDCT